MNAERLKTTLEKIQEYLGNGGLFNPEMMDHNAVRALILNCRDDLLACQERERKLREAIRDVLKRDRWSCNVITGLLHLERDGPWVLINHDLLKQALAHLRAIQKEQI